MRGEEAAEELDAEEEGRRRRFHQTHTYKKIKDGGG